VDTHRGLTQEAFMSGSDHIVDPADGRLTSLALDASDSPAYITDAQWRIVYVNAGFVRMCGCDLARARGRTPVELLAPETEPAHVQRMLAGFAQGQSCQTDTLLSLPDRRIWVQTSDTPILDDAGRLTNVVGVLADITRSKLYESLQRRVLEALVRDQPLEATMTLLCHEVERMAPGAVVSILSVDREGRLHPLAAPGMDPAYTRELEGLAIGPEVGSCGAAASRGEAVLCEDIANHPAWVGYRDLVLAQGLRACWSSPVHDSIGRVIGTFALYFRESRGPTPIEECVVEVGTHLCALAMDREESRQHIRQLAFYDSLTGLPNRSLLLAKADRALSEAARDQCQVAVLFVDLDRFKQVNDVFGHAQGDELLRIVGRRLCEQRQPGDIVGRLSGDEFVLVLPVQEHGQISAALDHMRLRLAEPCQIGGVGMTPSASIGISVFPGDGHDIESLLQRADLAMYQAKTSRRGGVSFYRADMNRWVQERMSMEAALRAALAEAGEGLWLAYQPQVDLADGHVVGVEALARWQHAELGEVSPSSFIALAEDTGLIHELSAWVLRQACRQLADWRRLGLRVPAISVNLSPMDFHNPELPALIAAELARHGLLPSDLVVEMTEGILLDGDPNTQATLHRVHALGIRLAMDDFGTGYSSLAYLRRLPISELKLDKSFIDDLERDASSRALSKAILTICESLDLRVVAEGIEGEQQCDILRRQGYHAGQGYLFSRPLPPAAFPAWLQAHEAAEVEGQPACAVEPDLDGGG